MTKSWNQLSKSSKHSVSLRKSLKRIKKSFRNCSLKSKESKRPIWSFWTRSWTSLNHRFNKLESSSLIFWTQQSRTKSTSIGRLHHMPEVKVLSGNLTELENICRHVCMKLLIRIRRTNNRKKSNYWRKTGRTQSWLRKSTISEEK